MRLLALLEGIHIGEPQGGLLYRWVEPSKALSNMKTDSMYPGKWQHNIPGVGAVAGISLGYDVGRWGSDGSICFVLDRGKLNANKIVDIPGQEVYNYSNATLNPIGDAHYASEYEKEIEGAEPDEAFYVGIIRPLSNALENIIITQQAPPRLMAAAQTYAEVYDIEVTIR